MFTSQELERYQRHLVIRDIGGPGQQKIKQAHVLVIGAGGLGSPVLMYLAAAGIGKITLLEDDQVSLSNLQRQILFSTEAVGRAKAKEAAERVREINPNVEIEARVERFTEQKSEALLKDVTIVADCSDNFETRYGAAKACESAQIPLVSAAVNVFDGSITVLKPYEKNSNGEHYPRYRDMFPQMPKHGTLPTCAETGVLGALTGLVGTLQAVEIIKEICGIGEGLAGKLLLIDSLAMRFETIEFI